MIFPWKIAATVQITVTKLTTNTAQGGTDVEAVVFDMPLRPFTLSRDWAIVGADALIPEIVSMAIDQIATGLQLVR
jgi:hypothetical protein